MGEVVDLKTVRRSPPARRPDGAERRGEIALFTGVRIERRAEESAGERTDPRDPRPRTPRRRTK